jgi:hypothetical protein
MMLATKKTPITISQQWLDSLPAFRRLAADLAIADGIFKLEPKKGG